MRLLKQIWQRVRQLSGDDAYERYLAHYAEHHAHLPDAPPPLGRAAFFKQWQDRTPFEAIASQFGLRQADVIILMRQQLSSAAFIAWRKRTRGQHTKHQALRSPAVSRHCSSYQHKQYRP